MTTCGVFGDPQLLQSRILNLVFDLLLGLTKNEERSRSGTKNEFSSEDGEPDDGHVASISGTAFSGSLIFPAGPCS